MLTKIEELKLIARCVATDDRRAFGNLVNAYESDLRRFLIGLSGGDVCLADDLAQETFIKAYTGLRSFKGAARFRTWLFTIASREYYSWLRQRREERLDDIDGSSVQNYASDNGSTSLTEVRHDIDVALRSLSPEDRGVILLFYLRDMPLKDVAKATGMTQANVKVRLHRARHIMAEALTDKTNFKNEQRQQNHDR